MPTTGVYAGSFDPPTNGHVWMIERGATLFDTLVVALGVNPAKRPSFSTAQRLEWLSAITARFANVRVESFGNLYLVDYARRVGATSMLRGVRSAADFAYEQTMRHVNADMDPAIETVFLIPPREIAEVSSSLVRALIGPEGWREVLRRYVPEPIYADLCKLHA